MGGINASLQLLNYKIDGISFEHSSSVNFILNNQFDPKKIKTSVSLRVPQKLKNTDNYICGLTMIVEYGSNAEDTYFKVSMSIVVFFVLRKEEIEIKNNLDIDMFLKSFTGTADTGKGRNEMKNLLMSNIKENIYRLIDDENLKRIYNFKWLRKQKGDHTTKLRIDINIY